MLPNWGAVERSITRIEKEKVHEWFFRSVVLGIPYKRKNLWLIRFLLDVWELIYVLENTHVQIHIVRDY